MEQYTVLENVIMPLFLPRNQDEGVKRKNVLWRY